MKYQCCDHDQHSCLQYTFAILINGIDIKEAITNPIPCETNKIPVADELIPKPKYL